MVANLIPALAGAAGGLMGLFGSDDEPAGTIDNNSKSRSFSQGRQSGSTEVDIPSWLRPLIQSSASTSSNALKKYQQLISGDTVADFNPDQMAAFEAARGFGGSEAYTTGLEGLLATARGDNLYGTDASKAAVQAAIDETTPGVLSAFGSRGTGGLAKVALGKEANSAFARLYDSERNRQQQAQGALPGYAQTPIDLLLGTGATQQQQAQNEISMPIELQRGFLDASASLPGAYSPFLGSSFKGNTTSRDRSKGVQQQPYFENETANILGGAFTGLGIADELGYGLTKPAAGPAGLFGLF